MIVCVCKAVSERSVRQCIESGASSFEELQIELGVATCCGCCEDAVRGILYECTDATDSQVAPLVFVREAVPA
jgi:bacterioferritin-associated ferredoxin